jgi:hypothetical protein
VAAGVAAALLAVVVVAPSPASTQDLHTNTVSDGDQFEIANENATGGHIWTCINDYCPSPTGGAGYIGAFYAQDAAGNRHLAYCSEAFRLAAVNTFYTYNTVALDGRLQYLTWRYDKDLLDAWGHASV